MEKQLVALAKVVGGEKPPVMGGELGWISMNPEQKNRTCFKKSAIIKATIFHHLIVWHPPGG
jgi:hypothetical protein